MCYKGFFHVTVPFNRLAFQWALPPIFCGEFWPWIGLSFPFWAPSHPLLLCISPRLSFRSSDLSSLLLLPPCRRKVSTAFPLVFVWLSSQTKPPFLRMSCQSPTVDLAWIGPFIPCPVFLGSCTKTKRNKEQNKLFPQPAFWSLQVSRVSLNQSLKINKLPPCWGLFFLIILRFFCLSPKFITGKTS